MHALLHSVTPPLQQATTDPRLHWRLLDTHGQVWVSLLWSHCSFLLGPGTHKVLLFQESISPSCVSSGGSMVGLMVTSSKRAYAIPESTAPRAPAPAAGDCCPVPAQETLEGTSGSVSVAPPGMHSDLYEPSEYLWVRGMGFDSKCNFTPPTHGRRGLVGRSPWGR